jgi:hypothetical protein
MTSFDLEILRGRWADSSRRVDATLALDDDAVRTLLATRTRRAFRHHSRWLVATSTIAAVVSIALIAFIAVHWGQWLYVLLAGLILPMAVTFAIVDTLQLQALRRLTFDHPTKQLRERLDALQARQVSVAKWQLLTSVLLWFPVLIVPLKGIFGIDIVAALAPSVIWVNLLLGVVLIPVGLLIANWMMRRWGTTPAMRRLLTDMAGGSWARARAAYETLESGKTMPVPPEVAARVRSLRRHLLVTAWLLGLLLGAIGVFNVMHGEQSHLIVAGVALILTIVPQLVATTVHRRALLDIGTNEHQLRQRAEAMARVREAYARATLTALPALTLPLAMVIVELMAGIDLLDVIGYVGITLWGMSGILAGLWMTRFNRSESPALQFAMNLVTFGALQRTTSLLEWSH